MDRPPAVPLHLTSLAILAPDNTPLYVRSFTGDDDELRAYHLAHSAVDVIEERIVMTSSPNRPADAYLGLLFCMEDQAFYGFQTPTKLRMVLSVALVDASVKDADIVAIFRAVHQLLLRAANNPFLSLPESFTATPAKPPPLPAKDGDGDDAGADADADGLTAEEEKAADVSARLNNLRLRNEPVPESAMFRCGPDDLRAETLKRSGVFTRGIDNIGQILCGPSGRA